MPAFKGSAWRLPHVHAVFLFNEVDMRALAAVVAVLSTVVTGMAWADVLRPTSVEGPAKNIDSRGTYYFDDAHGYMWKLNLVEGGASWANTSTAS